MKQNMVRASFDVPFQEHILLKTECAQIPIFNENDAHFLHACIRAANKSDELDRGDMIVINKPFLHLGLNG